MTTEATDGRGDLKAYATMRSAEWLGMHLPRRLGLELARVYHRVYFARAHRERATVARNLAHVLGHPPDSPLVLKATRETFLLYGRYWYETFALRTMRAEEMNRRFSVDGLDHVDRALEAGATDGDYHDVFKTIVVPVVDQFRPELVMISAGFDAHERDPLARMRLSTPGYALLTKLLCDAADRHCHGRIVAVTEGGYDLAALKACLQTTVSVLDGSSAPSLADQALGPTSRSRTAIAAVRAAQAKYWKL